MAGPAKLAGDCWRRKGAWNVHNGGICEHSLQLFGGHVRCSKRENGSLYVGPVQDQLKLRLNHTGRL